MNRIDIVNKLIAKNKLNKYLEIGVNRTNRRSDKVVCEKQTGVDPNYEGDDETILAITSDDFFATNKKKFDLIFIDGDHRIEQVKKDLKNALAHLSKRGIVVLHDCLPVDKEEAGPERMKGGGAWCGQVWHINGLLEVIVDTDHGVGITSKRSEGSRDSIPLLMPWIPEERAKMQNVISVSEFLEIHGAK